MSAEPLVSILGNAPALPLAMSFAVLAAAGERTRGLRRRRVMNERLHELRRPLQALALAHPVAVPEDGPDPLALALAALRDLDREVNGGSREYRRRPVEVRSLAVAAAERWRPRAHRSGRSLNLRWSCGGERANIDPLRVSQALDNLIANAFEHGGGDITIEGKRRGRSIDLTVRDHGAAVPWRRPAPDPRRGHGLRIAQALTANAGGALRRPERRREGTAATIVLPVAARATPRTGASRR